MVNINDLEIRRYHFNYADVYDVQTGGKYFDTFADFKEYIHGLYHEIVNNDIGGIQFEIQIADISVFELCVSRMVFADGLDMDDWIDIYIYIDHGGKTIQKFAEDIDMRCKFPNKLLRDVESLIFK